MVKRVIALMLVLSSMVLIFSGCDLDSIERMLVDEDTDSIIVFSDVVLETDFAYDLSRRYEKEIDLSMYSQRIACLYLRLVVFTENDLWYIRGCRFNGDYTGVYQITDEFVGLLKQNGIITGEE